MTGDNTKVNLEDMDTRNERVNQYMKDCDIRIIHFNKVTDDMYFLPGATLPRRATVAFRLIPNSNFAEVAVSYCSPKDEYNKETRKIIAVEKFAEGDVLKIRTPPITRRHNWAFVNMIRATILPL